MEENSVARKAQIKGWVGYVDNHPFWEKVTDAYGTATRLEIFRTRAAARQRFQDVRRLQQEAANAKRSA